MKIKELVSRGRNMLKEYYNDSTLSARFIYNVIKVISYELIKREKNKIYKSNIFKYIDLPTEEINLLESSCVPLNCMGCRVKIPKALQNSDGIIYSFLGSPDMSQSWTIVSPSSFLSKTKVRGSGKYAYTDGDYIYFNKCLPCYKLGYIPEDLNELLNLEEGCAIQELESAIPEHLLYAIFRMAPADFSIYLQKPYNHLTNKNETN